MGFSALANPASLVLLYTTWAALQTQGIDKDCAIPDRYRNKAPDYPSSVISPTVSTLLWARQSILWLSAHVSLLLFRAFTCTVLLWNSASPFLTSLLSTLSFWLTPSHMEGLSLGFDFFPEALPNPYSD